MEDYRLKRKPWYQMGTAVRSNRLLWGKGPLVSEEKGPTTRNSGCVVLQATWIKSHHVSSPAPNHSLVQPHFVSFINGFKRSMKRDYEQHLVR